MKKLMFALVLVSSLGISSLRAEEIESSKSLKSISKQAIELNLPQFSKYLQIGDAQELEGVYATVDRRYVIAIIKNKKKSHDYIGVVISADNKYWEKGEVKFNFVKKENKLQGFYYNQAGKAIPIQFSINEYGALETKLLEKLTLEEFKMSQLAGL
tara:strand:- start:1950 stop:2417 length:468 start_codon:yes stop_codon:yes gene_type:complete